MASQEDCYLKALGLTDFLYSELKHDIQRELEVREVLRRHPNPNIATYYDCREEVGRATGLCFKRYKETLSAKVNPRYLNKSQLRASGREQVDYSLRENFYGILEGIVYIHIERKCEVCVLFRIYPHARLYNTSTSLRQLQAQTS